VQIGKVLASFSSTNNLLKHYYIYFTHDAIYQAYEKSRLDIRNSFYHKITMTKTAFNNKNKLGLNFDKFFLKYKL
jgi:hypothetical protein